MAIAYDDAAFIEYAKEAFAVNPSGKRNAVLIDQFIEDAVEVDVDAVSDGNAVVIAGIMQHIEEAGIHSGDSACVLPPYKLSNYHQSIIGRYTKKLGRALQVKGS